MAPSSNQGDTLIPNDVLIEIFVLLPADLLVRFRLVCNSWFILITSIIRNLRFVEKHIHYHPLVCNNDHLPTILSTNLSMKPFPDHVLYSLNTNKEEKDAARVDQIVYPFKTPSSQLKILGSCHGLLCIQVTDYDGDDNTTFTSYQKGMTDYSSKVFLCLWNPYTNEFKQVPDSSVEKLEFNTRCIKQSKVMYGFGYDRFINDYKLVRLVGLSSKTNDQYSEVKVYTMGTNSWKWVDTDIPYDGSLLHLDPRQKVGLYVNGALHWIKLDSLDNINIILAYNIEDEIFQVVPVPKCSKKMMSGAELQVLRGCLCMFNSYRGRNEVRFEVWMMIDYGVKETWTKLFTVRTPVMVLSRSLKPLWIYKNGEVLMGNSTEDQFPQHLVIYDLHKFKSIGPQRIPFNLTNSIVHVGSLVSVKSGTYVGQEQQTRYVKKKRRIK